MALGDMVVDPEQTMFLSAGVLVSIAGAGVILVPQVNEVAGRRAPRGAVALMASLSSSSPMSVEEHLAKVIDETNADRATLLRFLAALRNHGLIATKSPPSHYADAACEPRRAIERGVATRLQLVKPASFLVETDQFLCFDHKGDLRARLSAVEVIGLTAFAVPRSVGEAFTVHERNGQPPLDVDEFERLAALALDIGVARAARTSEVDVGHEPRGRASEPQAPRLIVQERVASAVEAHQRESAQYPAYRTPVVPVNFDHGVAPLSLALLLAHAQEYDGGELRERYDFVPEFLTDEEHLLERAHEPSVFLFSNYVWNVERNLVLSALVKRANPDSITVHGGPSTPKYEGDTAAYFAEHDHVDVAVHGEGETTFTDALRALATPLPTRLDELGDVPGLTYRALDGVVRTADRERITDLDTIPSPYVLGLLDSFGAAQAGAIIETNRGCPYGCTFCDWGSATLSRIRKFSLERVFAELEWSARHKIEVASIADANFGIMERDVEIAQKIADLKRRYGYPRTVATNYAKNTVKYLRQIIEIFAEVEILTEGVVSLQSMDEPTLKIIRRSNIKLEKYNELSTEFRRSRLPLAADIMMGLPGSTPTSFRNDLQQCTNRDVRVRANPTQLLPNSPMNDPDYRREHGIVAKPGELVMETKSFTRTEWDEMNGLRRAYYSFDNWGVLRYVSRFVRQETGLSEVDFYDRIRRDVEADRDQWPIITVVLEMLEGFMAPPASWGLFIEEVRRYAISNLGLADDDALQTTLEVQLAHLPAPGRVFPLTIELAHDFVAWQNVLLSAREESHRDDWEQVVPRLATYPPATLTVADPNDICSSDVGKPMGVLGFNLRSWELDSPVARPRLGVTVASV
jgi:radical SAM superfamily enzyme YgiQ (UPF0313 family)